MKRCVRFLLAMAIAWAWNAQAQAPPPTQGTDRQNTSGTGNATMLMDSGRDIVLAVANPLSPPRTHAGSSLLGYAPAANYSKGQHAAIELGSIEQQYQLREKAGWPIKMLGIYCVVLEPPAGASREALLAALGRDRRIALAQPLNEFSVYSDADAVRHNDPYVGLQRGFVETHTAIAHSTSEGAGVQVAIIDTGVDVDHPDLRGRIRDVHDEVGGPGDAFDRDRHGTEVAGIIAATGDNREGIVGIAPKATVSVYKACWYPADFPSASARCNSFTLAKALADLADTDARIVNLSLGGPSDNLLDSLITQLVDQGRIVIAASPPGGRTDGFPGNAAGVLVVRSSATSPAPAGVLSAPGTDILTTQPNGGYDFDSGSSMAAAHVSGIAALLLSLAPRLDAKSLRELLLRHGRLTNGIMQVDAADAIAALREHGTAIR